MQFEYKAKDEIGRTVKGVLEADSEDALADLLDEQHLFLIEATPATKRPVEGRLFRRVSQRTVLGFTNDLATILASGIPLVEGLQDLAESPEYASLHGVIEDVLASIKAGSSLSAAFERHLKIFDTLYVSIVRAGEASGNLDRVLADLAKFLEWKADLRRDVIGAMLYPVMVLLAISGLIILLSVFVLPRFSQVVGRINAPLPPSITPSWTNKSRSDA